MTDVILSSFISLFALFGKEEQVDEVRAKEMLVNYLRRHFGVRNTDVYLNLYDDMRMAYDLADDIDSRQTVSTICSSLQGEIRAREKALLLLRLMEFCGYQEERPNAIFKTMAECFHISNKRYQDFQDFVNNKNTERVMLHPMDGQENQLRTLFEPASGMLLFTYLGSDNILFNDVPVLPGAYQVWLQSSVLKTKKGQPLYYSTIVDAYNKAKGKTDHRQRDVEFCGRDINFRFPNSNNGMHDLSFTLRSGELLAIMGGSGTGKTTLLSILNGSLVPQEGTLTINGHSISEPATKDLIGFVPQDDLLIEELTVYENLWFTAKLCFEGMPDKEIDKRVMNTLKVLGLDAAKDLKVGSAINKFISGGQRKRLNIALELIREPAVLFLDEPTSGLSSADTETVINLLKEQTLKGKLIIVNIHQPSSDVYKLFDRLWLLDKGGYPVFDGNPIDAITYFKSKANYADAETSACPTCGNVNPEIVLNIIDEKALNSSGEVSDERKMTPQEWHELYLNERPGFEKPAVTAVPPSDQKKPGALKQFLIFLHRNIKTKITNVQYLCIALLEAPLLALICALLTRYAPPEGYSVMDNKNLVSYFFMSVIVATFIGMSGSAEEIIKDRALLKRERFLHLSYSSYIWSKIVFTAGLSLIQTLLFIIVGNWIMGIHGLFFVWWLILFVTALLSNLIGLLLSKSLNSVVAIYISIPLLLIPQILLCGLVVDFSDLTPKSKTGNVPIIGDVIPSRWAYEALAVTSFTDNRYEAPFFMTDKEKYETQFYNMGFLYELQSQLETMKDEQKRGKTVDPEHLRVIHTNLPVLTAFCQMEPYQGDDSYASLKQYMKEAEQILVKRGNKATLKADALMSAMVREQGKEAVLKVKRDNYNLRLEDFVIGADQKRMLNVVDGTIVPRAGLIFLTPQSRVGRAPFYSSEKIVGSWHIKTLWFNIGVMLLMCIFVAIILFSNYNFKIIYQKMKKLTVFAIAFVALVFAACGGNKSAQNAEGTDSVKSFEQEQIEASIKMHFDSIASEIGKLKQFPFLQEGADGALKLTKEEKQVKPVFLLDPVVAENATTLAEKYRILSALDIDRRVARLYEMPTEDFDKAVAKLAADISDPSFKALDDNASVSETTQTLYDAMNENGRINYFWQLAAASLVEQLYIANQNSEKFLSVFDDESASNVTFRIVLILDALNRLSEYDPEIKPVADALAPLDVLNAMNVEEMKAQLAQAKDKIEAARAALIK